MKPFLGSCPDDKTDALVAHATIQSITDDDTEFDLSRLLVLVSSGAALGAAAFKIAPHVKARQRSRLLLAWNDRALPGMPPIRVEQLQEALRLEGQAG